MSIRKALDRIEVKRLELQHPDKLPVVIVIAAIGAISVLALGKLAMWAAQ